MLGGKYASSGKMIRRGLKRPDPAADYLYDLWQVT